MTDTVTITSKVDAEEFWSSVCGSGGETFSWWRAVEFLEDAGWDKPGVLRLGIEDPENSARTVYREVEAQDLADAYSKTVGRYVDACTGKPFTWDYLDACSADVILQVAVLGEVVYG